MQSASTVDNLLEALESATPQADHRSLMDLQRLVQKVVLQYQFTVCTLVHVPRFLEVAQIAKNTRVARGQHTSTCSIDLVL